MLQGSLNLWFLVHLHRCSTHQDFLAPYLNFQEYYARFLMLLTQFNYFVFLTYVAISYFSHHSTFTIEPIPHQNHHQYVCSPYCLNHLEAVLLMKLSFCLCKCILRANGFITIIIYFRLWVNIIIFTDP